MDHLREVEGWLLANAPCRGSDVPELSDDLRFSAKDVSDGLADLKNSALCLAGISKSIIAPLLCVIAPLVASFFSALLRFSVSPSVWQIAVLCLIKKSGSDRSNLNAFRAVHLLCFLYKWFTVCIRRRILPFVSESLPPQPPSTTESIHYGRKLCPSFTSFVNNSCST